MTFQGCLFHSLSLGGEVSARTQLRSTVMWSTHPQRDTVNPTSPRHERKGDYSKVCGDDRCDTMDEQCGAQVLSQQLQLV